MTILETILSTYPELEDLSIFAHNEIMIVDDGDGQYLLKWNYDKPIPKGLKLGK